MGWVTWEKQFSRHWLCSVLELSGPLPCFATVMKQRMPWLLDFQTESSFIRMGFYHSLIHLFTHSFIQSTNIYGVSLMCQAPCCAGNIKVEGTCPSLGVPRLGRAGQIVQGEQGSMPSEGYCQHRWLPFPKFQWVTRYSQMRPFKVYVSSTIKFGLVLPCTCKGEKCL